MGQVSDKPFASIESAQEFISLLLDTVSEAKHDVDTDIATEFGTRPSRRGEALRVAAVQLHNLEHHIVRTKRILNDLRSLRRLLFEERSSQLEPVPVNPKSLRRVRGFAASSQPQLQRVS